MAPFLPIFRVGYVEILNLDTGRAENKTKETFQIWPTCVQCGPAGTCIRPSSRSSFFGTESSFLSSRPFPSSASAFAYCLEEKIESNLIRLLFTLLCFVYGLIDCLLLQD